MGQAGDLGARLRSRRLRPHLYDVRVERPAPAQRRGARARIQSRRGGTGAGAPPGPGAALQGPRSPWPAVRSRCAPSARWCGGAGGRRLRRRQARRGAPACAARVQVSCSSSFPLLSCSLSFVPLLCALACVCSDVCSGNSTTRSGASIIGFVHPTICASGSGAPWLGPAFPSSAFGKMCATTYGEHQSPPWKMRPSLADSSCLPYSLFSPCSFLNFVVFSDYVFIPLITHRMVDGICAVRCKSVI